jgi:hypothetical protein
MALGGLWASGLVGFPGRVALRSARADERNGVRANDADSKESAADIEKLLTEFRKVYHLEQGQVIKRIKPPFPRGRLYDLDKWIL